MMQFANEKIRPGYVAIVEDGEFEGRFSDLTRFDGLEPETTEILVNRVMSIRYDHGSLDPGG